MTRDRQSANTLQGFGGWLALLLVMQVFDLLRAASAVFWLITFWLPIHERQATSNVGVVTHSILVCATFIVAVTMLALMLLKRETYRKWFPAQWVFWIISSLLTVIWLNYVFPDLPDSRARAIDQVIGNVVIGAGWVLYVKKSVRVWNTFIE